MIITFIKNRFKLLATLGGIIFLLIFFAHSTYGRVWNSNGSLNNDNYGDLFISIQAAKDILDGNNPYHLMDTNTTCGKEWRALYCYPLTQAWMLIPLTNLSNGMIKLTWSLLMALCLGLSCWLMLRLINQTKIINLKGWGIAFASLITLLCFEPIQNNYIYMQVNFFMLLGMIAFLYFYINSKKNIAAIALAFAISLKMLPILLIFFLLARKDWHTILITGICCLFFCFFPILWLGSEIFHIYTFYIKEVVLPRGQGVYTTELFFTLPRTIAWLIPSLLHNNFLIKACNILTLLTICIIDYKGKKKENSDLFSGAIYMLGILLLMPQSQMHYLILVIPAWFLGISNCLKHNLIKYWIIFGVSYALFWPMLWIQETPAHFISLILLLYLTTKFLFLQPNKELLIK